MESRHLGLHDSRRPRHIRRGAWGGGRPGVGECSEIQGGWRVAEELGAWEDGGEQEGSSGRACGTRGRG